MVDLILAEYRNRQKQPFRVEDFCFDKQIDFIRDSSSFKTAVCSRRSGKTIACAAHLFDRALSNPDRVCLYITLARNNAKKLIWKELLKINQLFNLGAKIDNTELSITLPNGSTIYVSGAKDKSEIEKFRGLAITLCYIDECQSFRDYIQELVDEVIGPALLDYAGDLCLIGTPGAVPAGYFYNCSLADTWSHHSWAFFDNPFIEIKSKQSHREVLDRELKRRGLTVDHPSIQREFFGKWVVDSESLVYAYKPGKNHYDKIPEIAGSWSYIIGVDLGHDDADAIAVLGYHKHLNKAYLFEERVEKKQGITELANQIGEMIEKYNPDKIVMDTGGLGKKIAYEMQKRYSLPIQAAEKDRKFEFIELLNDAMRTESFFAKKDSSFAQDCLLVEWDRDSEKLKVSDRYHSDICDAVLYAFRECLHWLSTPAPEVIPYQTPEWFEREEKEMEKAAMNGLKEQEEDIWADFKAGGFD
jgi:hypothetical protein